MAIEEEPVNEEIKKVVLAKLELLSKDKKMSVGSFGEFGRDELIEKVKKEDDVGKKMVQIELEFLRSLKEGTFV